MIERGPYTKQRRPVAVHKSDKSDDDRAEGASWESEDSPTSGLERGSGTNADDVASIPPDLRHVLSEAEPAVLLVDDAGRFLFANESATSLLDYASDEIVGVHFSEICAHDVAWLQTEFQRLKKNTIWGGRAALRRKTGSLVNVSVNASVLPQGPLPAPIYIALVHPVQASERTSVMLEELPYSLAAEDVGVLQLLIEGLEVEEIAVILQQSKPAVQSHIEEIRRKMKVRSHTEACIIALKRHLVS